MSQKIYDFTDLDVWKKSYILSIKIYQVTAIFPKEEQFGITNQIRRSSTSIGANIAEGFSRYHYKDRNKFYYQARGSISETKHFLILSEKLNFVNKKDYNRLMELLKITQILLNGLIKSTLVLSKK